ncbi:MAG: hypothetical protein ACRD0P_01335 [Stackebrandtia sp.]
MNDVPIKTLRTEPGKLWYAGTLLLPRVADEYAGMSEKVWRTRDTADAAFSGNTSPTGRLNAVYTAWNAVRDQFQDILARSSTNFGTSGRALASMGEQFAGTDTNTGHDLEVARSLGPAPVIRNPIPSGTPDPHVTQMHERTVGDPTGL